MSLTVFYGGIAHPGFFVHHAENDERLPLVPELERPLFHSQIHREHHVSVAHLLFSCHHVLDLAPRDHDYDAHGLTAAILSWPVSVPQLYSLHHLLA